MGVMERSRIAALVGSVLLVGAPFAASGAAAPGSNQKGTGQIVISPAEANGAVTSDKRANGRTKLKLDDGSQEVVIGLTDSTNAQAFTSVVVNRFTPSANQLPLTLDTVLILFPQTCQSGNTGLRSSMTFTVVVYVDPSGSGNPANATLAASQDFQLMPDDDVFQKIRIDDPVAVAGGDVWVGYINSSSAVDPRPIFHAALDTTHPKGRSWIFFNDIGDNITSGDLLSSADTKELIDAEGTPGNWLIRARGRVGATGELVTLAF